MRRLPVLLRRRGRRDRKIIFAIAVERRVTSLRIVPRRMKSRRKIGISARPWLQCRTAMMKMKPMRLVKARLRTMTIPAEDQVEAGARASPEADPDPEPVMLMSWMMKPVDGKHFRRENGAPFRQESWCQRKRQGYS